MKSYPFLFNNDAPLTTMEFIRAGGSDTCEEPKLSILFGKSMFCHFNEDKDVNGAYGLWYVRKKTTTASCFRTTAWTRPNELGAYTNACTVYATVIGKSPEGIPVFRGGNEELCRFVQKKAWESYRKYR